MDWLLLRRRLMMSQMIYTPVSDVWFEHPRADYTSGMIFGAVCPITLPSLNTSNLKMTLTFDRRPSGTKGPIAILGVCPFEVIPDAASTYNNRLYAAAYITGVQHAYNVRHTDMTAGWRDMSNGYGTLWGSRVNKDTSIRNVYYTITMDCSKSGVNNIISTNCGSASSTTWNDTSFNSWKSLQNNQSYKYQLQFQINKDSNSSNWPNPKFESVHIKSATIENNGAVVVNLIPVRRDFDGKYGFYDTINNYFIYQFMNDNGEIKELNGSQ